MNTKDVALVASKNLYRLIDNTWHISTLTGDMSLSNLCELAAAQKIASLWFMDELDTDPAYFNASTEVWDLLPNWNYSLTQKPPLDKKHQLVSVSGYRRGRGGQFRFSILFPFKSKTPWRFIRNGNPQNTLLAILHLTKAFGVTVTASASTVGLQVLKRYHEKHPDWLRIPEYGQIAPQFKWKDTAKDLIFARKPSRQEQSCMFLHKVDINGAYISRTISNKFGVGDPIEVKNPGLDEQKLPGAWRVTFKQPDRDGLPPIWHKSTDVWVVTPILQLLRNTGCALDVAEGVMWPEAHYVLKGWGNLLWTQRKQFQDATGWNNDEVCALCADACKQMATNAIGLTSYSKFDEPSFKNRPDFKATVVGAQYAALYFNMLKFLEERGYPPLMAYMDALYILSNEPDPFLACAPLLSRERLGRLGAYKHEWTLQTNDDVFAILASDEGVALKLEKLNKLVKAA